MILNTPTTLRRGDVVLATFPFADLSSTKLRPAVIIGEDSEFGDYLLAFITSQKISLVRTSEVAILPSHPEYL